MLTAVLLAKDILLPLGVTTAASAANIDMRKKNGSGLLNEAVKDTVN